MQQEIFPLCNVSMHRKICSMSCVASNCGLDSLPSKGGEYDIEFGAIFAGTCDGFLLRFCYFVPVGMACSKSLSTHQKIGFNQPRAILHVERNVGSSRQPVTSIRTCSGTKNVHLSSQADYLAPSFEGGIIGVFSGGGVFLFREEDLHPLIGLSKPIIDNASSFSFNSRRGIDGGICIEQGSRLNFFHLPQLLVEDPLPPTPCRQMKLPEPLKDMLWIDDALVLAFRTGCVCARLPAADPSAGVALLRVDAAAGDVPSLHPLPHGEFLVVCGREARAFDLDGQASPDQHRAAPRRATARHTITQNKHHTQHGTQCRVQPYCAGACRAGATLKAHAAKQRRAARSARPSSW